MGRLFWKFFLIFWLAQVVTAVGVGIAVWLAHPEFGPEPPAFGSWPPPAMLNEADRLSPPKPLSHAGEPPQHHLPPPTVPFLAGSIVSLLFAALLAWYFAKPIRSLRAAFESVADRLLASVGLDAAGIAASLRARLASGTPAG